MKWMESLKTKDGLIYMLQTSEAGMSSSNTGQSLELTVLNTNHACEESSNASTRKRNHVSKMQVNNMLIKLLDERLRILEEEDEILKEEFTRSMKERTELLNEVLNQFQEMQCHLPPKSQELGDTSSDGGLAIESVKKQMKTGLVQILFQEPNPSLVTRSGSAGVGAIQDPAHYRAGFLKHITSFLRNLETVQRPP